MTSFDLSPYKSSKIALILSGGVVKAAAWHLGVALALDELGFTLKNNDTPEDSPYLIGTYVGSSAGALINTYFASGFRPIDVIEASLKKPEARLRALGYKDMLSLKKPVGGSSHRTSAYDPFDGFPTFLKKLLAPFLSINGLFTTQGIHDYLLSHVLSSNKFDDYKSDFFVIGTQLDNSRKVIFSKYKYPNPHHDVTANYYTGIGIADAVAASTAVPPFYAPFPIKNLQTGQLEYYIDGEIRETLSTHVGVDNGCDLIISSWTHTPYHYHDEIGSLNYYGLPAICTQAIYLMIQKKIVASRARRLASEDIINTVNDYMKSHRFDEKHRKNLLSILERKLNFDPKVKFIDIHPDHENYSLFFQNSFSLGPDKMSMVVSMGYKKTMEVFRNLQ